jgi:hypothetical protein
MCAKFDSAFCYYLRGEIYAGRELNCQHCVVECLRFRSALACSDGRVFNYTHQIAAVVCNLQSESIVFVGRCAELIIE